VSRTSSIAIVRGRLNRPKVRHKIPTAVPSPLSDPRAIQVDSVDVIRDRLEKLRHDHRAPPAPTLFHHHSATPVRRLTKLRRRHCRRHARIEQQGVRAAVVLLKPSDEIHIIDRERPYGRYMKMPPCVVPSDQYRHRTTP
jgi:hypothetical protein